MNGAGRLAATLKCAGVDVIFSLSGNQIMPVYDACIDAEIRIVHVRHEAAAVYMADAWAQLTGGVGVALLTAGPGFANGLSPLFSARQAESPVLLLSGDSPVAADGNGAFQEMAQTEMTRPIVKNASRVMQVDHLADMLKTAFHTALSGRHGPVHLALPFDVLNAEESHAAEFTRADFVPEPRTLSSGMARQIADAVAAAERPLVLFGPQYNRSRAAGHVARLESALGAPVVVMESPRGLRDPALGAFAEMLAGADLVVSLGKKFDFTLGFARGPVLAPDAGIIVVDPEPDCIDKANELAGDRIRLSDTATIAEAIDEIAALAASPNSHHDAWRTEVSEALVIRQPAPAAGERINPQEICESVSRFLAAVDDPVLICDGGEFGQWAQAGCSAPLRIINGMSGAIGGGLCYALAAKLARPDATIVALMGDGTAGFHFTEFDTAAREGADFIAVIGNDDCWNAEHQIQLRDYGPDRLIGCRLSPDARYDLAAAAFGGHGEYVTGNAGLDAALQRAAASARPACINVAMAGAAAPTVTRTSAAHGGQ